MAEGVSREFLDRVKQFLPRQPREPVRKAETVEAAERELLAAGYERIDERETDQFRAEGGISFWGRGLERSCVWTRGGEVFVRTTRMNSPEDFKKALSIVIGHWLACDAKAARRPRPKHR